MFRLGGNISIENADVKYGQGFRVNVGSKKDLMSYIQYLLPLSSNQPCFYIKVNNLKPDTVFTFGISSLDIDENTHTGSWNNTIGYESNTGRCVCSHRTNANTSGKPILKNDTVGLMVTYFGDEQSTVIFYHNDEPVATRYHFESNKSKYLPIITFDNGPVDVDVWWQNAIETIPYPPDGFKQWTKPTGCIYNETENCYENLSRSEDLPVQCTVPLGKLCPHYKCIQLDVSPDGQGSSVGIASCSPLKPTPTCSLLRDYYTWVPKLKLKHGAAIGWGIYYNPNEADLNDKREQLVLLFVTYNSAIVDVLFVLQPEGGFFPLVLMQPWASKVRLDFDAQINIDDTDKLRKLFNSKYEPAVDVYNSYLNSQNVKLSDMEVSSENVVVTNFKNKTVIKINETGVPETFNIQYKKPLSKDRRFFFVEINELGPNSNVIVGIAPTSDFTNRLLGQSKNTVGYHSNSQFFSGLLYCDGKAQGNMSGKQYGKGDSVGVEVKIFDGEMKIVLFSKNFKPVGTRFHTCNQADRLFPTISVCSQGEPIELVVYWQSKVSVPPTFNIKSPDDWCVPDGTKIDLKDKCFYLPPHFDHSLCIQGPYSLNRKYNHFEIILIDKFDKNNPPPALALCTASPFDPPPISQFKQDYLRFWPQDEAMDAIKQNDRIGWGIIYSETEKLADDQEQLVICYLTINRRVSYLRVLFQPPGGFYPVVIAPPNVYRVKVDFSATRANTNELTSDQVKQIIDESRIKIEHEQMLISQGILPRIQNKNGSIKSKACNLL